MRIGFIGVGNMGAPMARNLLSKGHEVLVIDKDAQNASRLVADGAKIAASLVEMAGASEAIVSMLPSGAEVRAAYLGEGGVIAAIGAGAIIVDCSTTDVAAAREVAGKARDASVSFLDAPVSGGVAGATAASLTFMVGGDEAAVERARPILQAMGKNIVHVGGAGAGQAAKICNNLILGISMIGVCEAFVLAERLGLSPDKLYAVSANSSGQCWSLTSYCPVPGLVPAAPSNRDYAPGFSGQMMLKDLRLACEAGESANVHLNLTETAKGLYERFVQNGFGSVDFSGIIRDLRNW
jgi:3-hydroxyisobutyrate dehydrogenase